MRNQQQESGNRYQFRLHPPAVAPSTTTTAIDEEQQPQQQQTQQQQQQLNNNNNNINKNINNSDNINNNKCVKSTQMSASMKVLTATAAAAASNKDNNGNSNSNSNGNGSNNSNSNSTIAMLQQQRKQFTPTSDVSNASFSSAYVAGSIQDDISDQCSLTQAGLEEYNIRSSSYYDQPVLYHHQKQSSYAQSEGYHSYVSSSDSSSATPFLDRLRQESELLSRQSHHWSQNDLSSVSSNSIAPSPTPLLLALNGRDSGSGSSGSIDHLQHNSNNNNNNNNNNNSSESTSSTETLKWLGSMSDVSEASHATGYSAVAESVSSSQLIVHSSRVRTPKRHHSESVLYLNNELHPPPQQQQQQQHQALVSLQHPLHVLHLHQQPHTSHYTAAPTQISPTLSTRVDHSPPPPTTTTMLSTSSMRINPNHRHSPSYPPAHTPHSQQATLHLSAFTPKKESADIINLPNSSSASVTTPSTSPPNSIVGDLQTPHKSNISVTISNSEALVTISPQPQTAAVKNKTPVVGGSDAPAAHVSGIVVNNSSSGASPTTAATTPLTVNTNISSSSGSPISNTATSAISSISPSSSTTTSTLSPSKGTATSYRSNHRLFPVSTYTEPVHNNTSQYVQHPKPQYSSGLQKPSQSPQQQQLSNSPPNSQQMKFSTPQQQQQQQQPHQQQQQSAQASWQSVAELINDFERSNETSQPQPQKYSYIDPSKTHRVPNPALKAFQKNAVQSYFERQQQQQNSKEQQHSIYQQHPSQQLLLQQQQQQQLMRHSFQPTASAKEIVNQQILRNSLPNTFAASTAATATTATAAAYQQQQQLQYVSNKPMRMMSGQHLSVQTLQMPSLSEDNISIGTPTLDQIIATTSPNKPPSPAPPPPPPRTRSLMPTLLRRSSSASDYAEFRDQYMSASQEKLQAQSVKNISSSEKSSFNDCGMPPPPPPPRGRASLPVRRTSSASEYAALRDKVLQQQAAALVQHRQRAPHQYYATPAPPLVHMPQPSAENWVPERPPKNPNLRVPSPELPPPPAELLDASLSDEPLPPPPPEILHRQPPHYEPYTTATQQQQNTSFMLGGELLAAPAPNRRNSFAGSSTRKPASVSGGGATIYNRSTSATAAGGGAEKQTPPAIPKKPSTVDLLQASRPASSMAQQCNKAHKVILNGGGLGISSHQQQQPPPPPLPAVTAKTNANRKRPHNPAAMINIPPIMENPSITGDTSYNSGSNINKSIVITSLKVGATTKSSPPPPLKPRMPITAMNQQGTTPVIAFSNNLRCNSKASYLPRQSLEKLNNSDPDHGSYKLTLTSNEDLVGHTKPVGGAYDILAHNGKLPNNLPDVLPLGAKLQPQPASPTSANSSPLRYSSSSNISTATSNSSSSPTHQHPTTAISSGSGYPPMYPTQHRYSTPAMNYYNHSNNQAPSYTRSQSYDLNSRNSNTSPTKFMSQSTIDLKKTHNLETTLEEASTTETSKLLLSPAQSENNLSSSINNNKHSVPPTKPQSPFAARREFHRTADMGGRTMSLDERGGVNEEGRIVRAELVNTTLPNSPNTGAHKTITRKDSLRENIEKITQLQSKLMSAHLSAENTGLLGSFSNKTSTAVAVPSQTTKTETEATPQTATTQSDNDTLGDKPKLDIVEPITDTMTPPMLPKTPPPQMDSTPLETTVSAIDPTSHILQMDSTTDGLKLMQRSELILRVNPLTIETASQTDDLPDSDMGRLTAENHQQYNKEDSQTRTTLQPRQRHPIELDCDTMSKELAELLAPNDKLIDLLTPHIIKSPSDYVSNLYNPNVPLRPTKRDVGTSTLMRMKTRDNQAFDQATEKSGIITVELQYAEIEVSLTNGSGPDSCDMLKKKVDELIRQLNRKLKTLNKEQTTIGEESAINDELGNSLVTKLSTKVRPIEATKFRTYIDDIGHITSLLLSLSERLAKSENALSTIEENDADKKLLESKRDRLMEQLEEAKRLKEDIDRRGTSVSNMLERNLTVDEFADFDYFINMKAKLIADARDIADKIKCSEEQLCALSEALIQSDC